MKTKLKCLLALLALSLAACGATRFTRQGRVIDSENHLGIPDVKVDCVLADGTVEDSELTSAEGTFALWYDQRCDHLHAQDQSAADGGTARYADTEAPYNNGSGDIAVEMARTR